MALTPEQLEKRRRQNTVIFKVFSVLFVAVALLFLATAPGALWWLALIFLITGS
jgi:hypothetical protein